MRLQKYLASCGVASRRRAEALIAQGQVTLNGQTGTRRGVRVAPGDEVAVAGQVVRPEAQKRYILYHKPAGEVTTAHDPQGRPAVLDHFRDFPVRLYPVGRLDFDSEGLLILTNDGDLTQRLTHPSHQVKKSYIARVSNHLGQDQLRQLRQGVLLDNRRTAPAQVRLLREDPFSCDVLITFHVWRFRQFRRMVEAVGHEVVRLKRVQYDGLVLGDLPRGQWRELSAREVALLDG